MATVNVKGTILYYEESGPALLFIHVGGGTANSWDGQMGQHLSTGRVE